jgi:glyoxylase-like metal-dependent hydrolase (beta-lactamase superfamily II)
VSGPITDFAEACWAGAVPAETIWKPTGRTEELAPGVVFLHTFANVTLVRTSAGLVLVDTSTAAARARTFALVRSVDPGPLRAAIYTHGHADHALGLPPFLSEARERGWPRPSIVGHRNVAARFARYRRTHAYNALINARQFGTTPAWPTDYDEPDVVYDTELAFTAGDATLELHHARGETDDHTWIWWAERGILWTGDQFLWVAPNAGNPQKVQRYAAEWAASLRVMSALDAVLLIPGHGPPVLGRARVRQALDDTAEWLETLERGTVARMNAGFTLEAILAEVQPPGHLAARPYLQAVYDEPDYVVRNVWRLNGGWWDGVASHLKPAREAELGREVARLAGGVERLVARARELATAGDLALAGHLIDWAIAVEPDSRPAHAARAAIYEARARDTRALMTRGIFGAAARESAARLDPGGVQEK